MKDLKILHINETCTGCGACVSVCSKRALSLKYNSEGFYCPQINEDKCTQCHLCEKICHVLNNEVPTKPLKNYRAYMVKASDKDIVRNSSSGGAFSLLANEILRDGGVVYGARYNFDKERLEHASTDNVPLSELRKSKYIESYMGSIFSDVRRDLVNKRKVMFVGTPCQIEGLHRYLNVRNIDMSNILLVRFVCHGVPSNKFFTEYKHYEEKKYKSSMTYFDFRPKTNGWRVSEWLMRFANGKEEKGPYYYYYYYYYYYFQLNTLLRTCCYSCRRVFHEVADITIADFWGIAKYRPENKDQEGISLMLVHNDKPKYFIDKIRDNSFIEEIPHSSIEYIYKEVNDREEYLVARKQNIKDVEKNGYMNFVRKTLYFSILKNRIQNKTRKILKKIIR